MTRTTHQGHFDPPPAHVRTRAQTLRTQLCALSEPKRGFNQPNMGPAVSPTAGPAKGVQLWGPIGREGKKQVTFI